MAKQDKLEQVLLIDPPQELKFTGPFTVPVTSYITLKNPSNDKVCFKIKTTAPKQYCVRPNSGIIDGNSEVKIGVSLQPQTPDFPGHENYKHKFMVQTMLAPGDDCDQEQMWKEMKPDKLMDSKLKCVFVSGPESGTTAPAESAGDAPTLTQEKKLTKTPKVSTVKASPKAAQEGEVMRAAAAEVKSLREEESSLRQENLMLKEELLRLQRSVQMAGNARESSDSSLGSSSQPMPLQEISPKMHIAFALIAVLVGVMLGKFLL